MKIQKLFIALFFVILSTQIQAQVTSLASGPWSSASTWSSGVVPDSNTNVLVGAHNITIDDGSAVCKNVAFSDTGHFIMSADISVLKVYGDFTLRDSLHRVFTTWTTGAKIVFTGSALVQNLVGWKITAWPTGTGASTSFQEMIVDNAHNQNTCKENLEHMVSFQIPPKEISKYCCQTKNDVEQHDAVDE